MNNFNDSLIKLLDAAFLPLIKRYANDGEYLPGARAFTEAALSVFQQHVPSKRELRLLLVEVFRKHGYIFYEIPPVFEEAAQAVLNPSAFKWGDASTRKDEDSPRPDAASKSPKSQLEVSIADKALEKAQCIYGHGDSYAHARADFMRGYAYGHKAAATNPLLSWKSIDTAPKDGRRIALLVNFDEYHGWYEESFTTFMGMDAEWNLIVLNPKGWRSL